MQDLSGGVPGGAAVLSYPLCDRTVTLYRLEKGQVQRQVVEGCYYFWQTKLVKDLQGQRQDTKFLLVMPGSCQRIFVGDRVFDGVGPHITAQDWHRFLPSQVTGLGEVSYVRACRWDGEISHIEAGNQ